ncbi:MAG: hypothetical protein HGA37_04255, partial [Lentimicrobium sp.]|nr:hypothetical protein [Lentimicrobium sp.]
ENKGIIIQKLIRSGIFPVLVVASFLFTEGIKAQKVTPDSTKFPIGSQVNVTIELETVAGNVIEWPVLEDTISRSIEIVSKNLPDTIRNEKNNNLVIRQVITITSFDTGFIVLPPLTFRVKDKNNAVSELKSEAVLLEIFKVPVDISKEIRDIKPVFTAPYTLRDFLPWLMLAAAVGLLITLAWFYIRNRKKNKPLIKLPSRPQKPPHVIALEQLEELRREQVWQKGQVKEYYTRLTDILREYFEKRYGVNAAEMTSDEILFAMKDFLTEVSSHSDLKKLLTLSDLAKFAKGQPIGAENELSLTYARTIVLNTADAPSVNESKNGYTIEDNSGNGN